MVGIFLTFWRNFQTVTGLMPLTKFLGSKTRESLYCCAKFCHFVTRHTTNRNFCCCWRWRLVFWHVFENTRRENAPKSQMNRLKIQLVHGNNLVWKLADFDFPAHPQDKHKSAAQPDKITKTATEDTNNCLKECPGLELIAAESCQAFEPVNATSSPQSESRDLASMNKTSPPVQPHAGWSVAVHDCLHCIATIVPVSWMSASWPWLISGIHANMPNL